MSCSAELLAKYATVGPDNPDITLLKATIRHLNEYATAYGALHKEAKVGIRVARGSSLRMKARELALRCRKGRG